jgi:DNA-binding NtrC family response regulator
MAAAKVLLVDDESEFVSALSERMTARWLDVDTACDGPTALELVKKRVYDAIVLDLMMPEMDGLETLQRLLAFNANLQVIMLTGHGSIQQGVDAVKFGAVDFLEKPADIDTLVGKIEAAQAASLKLFEHDLDLKISNIVKKRGW